MPRLGDLVEQSADQLDDLRRQAFGRLVDHDQVGVAHQRAAQRQHLLLAARQHAGRCRWRSFRRGNSSYMSSKLQRPTAPARFSAEHQVLLHGQARERCAVLGHVAEAEVRDLVGPAGRRSPGP